jgi:hypothetical protein
MVNNTILMLLVLFTLLSTISNSIIFTAILRILPIAIVILHTMHTTRLRGLLNWSWICIFNRELTEAAF